MKNIVEQLGKLGISSESYCRGGLVTKLGAFLGTAGAILLFLAKF